MTNENKLTIEVTLKANGGEIGADGRGETSRHAEFESELDVAPGVRMVRFAGGPFVEFVGRRKNPPTNGFVSQVYRIRVDRAARSAAVWRDDDILFTLGGGTVGPGTLEHLALAALRKHLMRSRARRGKKRGKGGASRHTED